MEAIRSKIPVFQPKNVNLGLGAAAILILVIEISCMTTARWVVDYYGCDFSLQEAQCDGSNADLTGDAKKAADAMAGLGSIALLCIMLNLTINCLIFFAPCGMTKWFKIMTITGLISCAGTCAVLSALFCLSRSFSTLLRSSLCGSRCVSLCVWFFL